MSLCNYYDDRNKKTDVSLAIRYSVAYELTRGVQVIYTVTRAATKRYSYIGMDRATAEACKAEKISQYTTQHVKINEYKLEAAIIPDPKIVTECGANVTISRDRGCAWKCDIDVNETDIVRVSNTIPTELDGLFDRWTASRDYDDTVRDGIITLNSARFSPSGSNWGTMLTLTWDPDFFGGETDIANLLDGLKVYYKSVITDSWHEYGGGYYVVGRYSIRVAAIALSAGFRWRVSINGFMSNSVISVTE